MTYALWSPFDKKSAWALWTTVIGSGVICALTAWVVFILWLGDWPAGTEQQRLAALSTALYMYIGTLVVMVSSLGLAINRRDLEIKGPAGMGVKMGGGGPDPSPIVTTTTKTEIVGAE